MWQQQVAFFSQKNKKVLSSAFSQGAGTGTDSSLGSKQETSGSMKWPTPIRQCICAIQYRALTGNPTA